jgi:hypothetical protein
MRNLMGIIGKIGRIIMGLNQGTAEISGTQVINGKNPEGKINGKIINMRVKSKISIIIK